MTLTISNFTTLCFMFAILVAIAAFGGYWLLKQYLTRNKKDAKAQADDIKVVGAQVLCIDSTKTTVVAPPISLFDEPVVAQTINDVDDGDLADIVTGACRLAIRQNKMLQIELNTHGGNPVIARSVVSILRHFGERHELRIVVRGYCQSAGMLILMAVGPSRRYAVAGSEFLIHAARMAATDERNDFTRGTDAHMLQTFVSSTRIDHSSLTKHLASGEDCVFSAEDALRMGVIGAII